MDNNTYRTLAKNTVNCPAVNTLHVEQWLPVPGFEGAYQVSDRGRVLSLDRLDSIGRPLRGRLMKTPLCGGHHTKYPWVGLRAKGKHFCGGVHQLVALAFIGPCPPRHQVNHVDGDKTHNRPGNLEYATGSRNLLHFHRILRATCRPTSRWPRPLKVCEVQEIRRLRRCGVKLLLLAAMFRTSRTKVCDIVAGRFQGVAA